MPKLRKLNLARNRFKRLHLDGIDPFHFRILVELDFSFNLVNIQEDLMQSLDFENLKILIITGN